MLTAAAAQFATPIRAGILDVSRSNLRISREVLRLEEWVPPWDPKVVEAVDLYWVALIGSLIAIVWLRSRVSTRDRCLLVVMTAMSLYAARFIIFWAVALVPFWAQVVERTFPIGMFAWARGRGRVHGAAGRSMIGLAAGLAIVLGVHPARFRPIVHPEIPLDGVRALRDQLSRISTDLQRLYLGRPAAFSTVFRAGKSPWTAGFISSPIRRSGSAIDDASAGRIAVDELERRHRPDAFFLFPPRNRPLIKRLSLLPALASSVTADRPAWRMFLNDERPGRLPLAHLTAAARVGRDSLVLDGQSVLI